MRTRRSLLRTALIALPLLSGIDSAEAATGSTPTTVSASSEADVEKLFREGAEYFEQGKLELAYEKFSEAWRRKPTFDVAANLAATERKLGKHKDAVVHLEYALANVPPSVDPRAKEQMREALDASKAELGSIAVDVPDKTVLFLDGAQVGEAPMSPWLVEPGTHEVGAALRGQGGATETLQVGKGQHLELKLELTPGKGPTLPDIPAEKVSPKGGLPWWPAAIAGGVGLAGVATGLGLALAAGSEGNRADELTSALPSKDACVGQAEATPCAEIVDHLEARDGLTNASIGAAIAGGALLAGGGAWLAISLLGAPSAGASEVAVVPWVGPTVGGLVVGGKF